MRYDLSGKPASFMRRRDRCVDDEEWIREFLRHTPIGALASVHDGQPFINTNIFVYDDDADLIYFHTAQVGRTRWNLERDSQVCFSVSELGRILPAETAKEFSLEYAGVVIFGKGSIVEDHEEKYRALDLMLRKYAPHLEPGSDYRPSTEDELEQTTVYRIEIQDWTGKMKQVEPDFPGAFTYPYPGVLARGPP